MVETDLGSLSVDDAGAGPAILMWPSLFFGRFTLRPLFEALSRNHRVLLVDPPGHGESDPAPHLFSSEDCAKAFLRALDDAKIDRAVIVGQSWGGLIAVTAALLFPERVRGLVIVNGPMQAFSAIERIKFSLMIRIYQRFGMRPFMIRSITKMQLAKETRVAHPPLVAALSDLLRSGDRHGMLLATRSVVSARSQSLMPRLGELHVPTLFVTGDRDQMMSLDQARAAASAIDGSRLEILEGSAHQAGLEASDKLSSLVAELISALPADAPT